MKMKKFLVGLAVALVLLVAVMTLTGSAAIPGPELGVFMSPLLGPPDGAQQVLMNTGFEEGENYWDMHGASWVDDVDVYEGEWSLVQGGNPLAWGYTEQEFNLLPCVPGPVWVHVNWNIYTPAPLTDPWNDVTEGWIQNSQHVSVVYLWERYDIDMPNEWQDTWYRVEGLFDALQGNPGYMTIGSSVNSNPDTVTDFVYDNVELWCIRDACVTGNCVYFPGLYRNH